MFGYVKPQKSELLVREWEEYGGIYCTLCHKLGKDYGPAARLALNYDCTFYALLMLSVSGRNCPAFFQGRCAVNPFKKCRYCAEDGWELSAASALTMILAYHKARDNLRDAPFFKSLASRAAYPFLSLAHRRAAKKYPKIARIAEDSVKEQAEIEKRGDPGIDRCAEPTARMLAGIFELCGEEGRARAPSEARVLHEAGYYLGRWVYLIDAADDIAEDVRRKSFNPFALKFGLDENSPQDDLARARDYANQVLNGTAARLAAAANLLAFNRFGAIVQNIITLGLPLMQKERLFKKENTDVRSL